MDNTILQDIITKTILGQNNTFTKESIENEVLGQISQCDSTDAHSIVDNKCTEIFDTFRSSGCIKGTGEVGVYKLALGFPALR